MKFETCRPVYILFNVYEINCCVIDWHICVFYICQNPSVWQILNLNKARGYSLYTPTVCAHFILEFMACGIMGLWKRYCLSGWLWIGLKKILEFFLDIWGWGRGSYSPTGLLLVEVSNHTQLDTHNTHTSCRTPLTEWSARRRGRYLNNTQQKQETSIHALQRDSNSGSQ